MTTQSPRETRLSTLSVPVDLPFNSPKYCIGSEWETNGITFVNQSMAGQDPLALFITSSNQIYLLDNTQRFIRIFNANNSKLIESIPIKLKNTWSVFVLNNEIYFQDGIHSEILVISRQSEKDRSVMNVPSLCTALFIDLNHFIYCSVEDQHFIIRQSLRSNPKTFYIGKSEIRGNKSDLLNNPRGIYVDHLFNVYVCDCFNDRIQFFLNQSNNGTTISTGQITLKYPTGIIKDGNGFLFIVDQGNHRIIQENINGFRCLISCHSTFGSTNEYLHYPYSMAFDQQGNIFVSDKNNHRIQLFKYRNNSCLRTTTNSPSTTSFSNTYHRETSFISTSHLIKSSDGQRTSEQLLTTSQQSKGISSDSFIHGDCSSPRVKLIPWRINRSQAKQYFTTDEILISSTIQLNCSLTKSLLTSWKIFRCEYDCLIFNGINSSSTEMEIPSSFFRIGLYRIELIVQMKDFNQFQSSRFTFIRINPSPILIDLIPYGTSFITLGKQQNLSLHPIRYSFFSFLQQSFDEKVFHSFD